MTDATPAPAPNRGPRDPVGLAALQIAAALERGAAALERIAVAFEGLTVESAAIEAVPDTPPPPVKRVIDAEAIPDGGAFVDGVNVADGPTGDPVEDLLAQIEATEE